MSQRNVFILLAAVIVLVLLVTVGERIRTPSSSNGETFVPGLEAALADVERVTVVKANGEIVATLERRPETWVVTEKNGYPADLAKLRQGLRALGEAKILEAKTANAELYSRLGVEDVSGADATGVAVSLTAPGKELPTLVLGNAEGSKYRYARRAGDAQSYLIDRNPDLPRSTSQWLDAGIIDVRSDRVRQVTITHPDGETLSLSKASADAANYEVAGVPAGRELMYPGVANVVGNSLRELNLEDVEPATNPVEGEPVVVEFRTFDGLVVRALGVERGDESWVSFEASVDAEQAASAAAAAPAAPPAAADAPTSAAAPATAAADPAAEAARINAKVGGWRYRIASFQYDQMTRRIADLLKPPA
jgi:hypothetical protein